MSKQNLSQLLKPCPFCGSTDITELYDKPHERLGHKFEGVCPGCFSCNDCGAEAGHSGEGPDIIVWNTRPQSTPRPTPELREALERIAAFNLYGNGVAQYEMKKIADEALSAQSAKEV